MSQIEIANFDNCDCGSINYTMIKTDWTGFILDEWVENEKDEKLLANGFKRTYTCTCGTTRRF